MLYSREAHPSQSSPQPTTTEERVALATQYVDQNNVEVQVLIDPIANPLRETLGRRNNSAIVIDGDGTVCFKADWENPDELEQIARHLLEKPDKKVPSDRTRER